ncbi:hypothetical protein [Methylobacter svalbardensis]|uniref:hypothetical protein n=1 Tax=Methylobacter svalbardensis TaxID=3080016 RepID=UPI0030EB8610
MITLNYLSLPIAVLALSISGAAIAKQPNTHDNHHNESSGPDARLLNSNKQSETGDNLRGRERADERQDINQSRDHDNSRDADDWRGQEPRYNQYNQQNPVDRNIDDVRSRMDNIQQRTIDNINQKTRELPEGQPRYRR